MGDFGRYAYNEWRKNRGQTSKNRQKNQAPERIEPQHGDIRVINVIHRLGRHTNESKAESQ